MNTRLAFSFPVGLIAALLCADVGSYLFEKIACDQSPGQGANYFLQILHRPAFYAMLALAPIQFFTWTRILARMDLSKAYPISGLNMPLTLVASTILLHEHLSWPVWIGAALITLGGAVIGPGANTQHMPPPRRANHRVVADAPI